MKCALRMALNSFGAERSLISSGATQPGTAKMTASSLPRAILSSPKSEHADTIVGKVDSAQLMIEADFRSLALEIS